MRSQERTRGLQLGSIPDAPIKAEREKATYLVCIENDTIGADERRQGLSRNSSWGKNPDAGGAMKGPFGFLGIRIATKIGRKKHKDLVRRWTERRTWHHTSQFLSRAQALDVLLMRR